MNDKLFGDLYILHIAVISYPYLAIIGLCMVTMVTAIMLTSFVTIMYGIHGDMIHVNVC